jgi:Uma2 family endonuclease
MVSILQLDDDLLYPDSDGKPMSDNTEQYEWIVKIKENLEILFAENTEVFIAGDLLWYPIKSTLISPTAPDVLVVFGRPKGRRGSYRQWQENNIPVHVVFEILSPSNTKAEMTRKFEFYQRYGVEEYYVYNPDNYKLEGWLRQQDKLIPIVPMNGWISPHLGIQFVLNQETGLEIYYPNGDKFLTSVELAQKVKEAEKRAEKLANRLRELGINPDEL